MNLVYINPFGFNADGDYVYEFFFSENSDIVWGDDWAEQCPSICENVIPNEDNIDKVAVFISEKKLHCAQNQSCFSMQDCIDGCISIAYFDNGDRYVPIKYGISEDDLKEIINTYKLGKFSE